MKKGVKCFLLVNCRQDLLNKVSFLIGENSVHVLKSLSALVENA